jgi:hypothetical protein
MEAVSVRLSVTQYLWLNRLSDFHEILKGAVYSKSSNKREFREHWYSTMTVVFYVWAQMNIYALFPYFIADFSLNSIHKLYT